MNTQVKDVQAVRKQWHVWLVCSRSWLIAADVVCYVAVMTAMVMTAMAMTAMVMTAMAMRTGESGSKADDEDHASERGDVR